MLLFVNCSFILTKGHFQGIGKFFRSLRSSNSFVNAVAPWIPLGKCCRLLSDRLSTFRAVQPHVSLSGVLEISSLSSWLSHKDAILLRAKWSFTNVGICSTDAGMDISSLSQADSFCNLFYGRKKKCHLLYFTSVTSKKERKNL